MRFTSFFSILALAVLHFACGASHNTEDSRATHELESNDSKFQDFVYFPDRQFKNLALGESNKDMVNLIQNLEVVRRAANEVHHFYFPIDSTEIIIPEELILSEFKVFLHSKNYLRHEEDLRLFFEEKADYVFKHPQFPVFQYTCVGGTFKMTYFSQPTYIRLHFKYTEKHS